VHAQRRNLTSEAVGNDGSQIRDNVPGAASQPGSWNLNARGISLSHLEEGELQAEATLDLDRQIAEDEETAICKPDQREKPTSDRGSSLPLLSTSFKR
jgi:hypothetical protein